MTWYWSSPHPRWRMNNIDPEDDPSLSITKIVQAWWRKAICIRGAYVTTEHSKSRSVKIKKSTIEGSSFNQYWLEDKWYWKLLNKIFTGMVATTLITIKLQNVEGNGKTIALISRNTMYRNQMDTNTNSLIS